MSIRVNQKTKTQFRFEIYRGGKNCNAVEHTHVQSILDELAKTND